MSRPMCCGDAMVPKYFKRELYWYCPDCRNGYIIFRARRQIVMNNGEPFLLRGPAEPASEHARKTLRLFGEEV